MVSKTITTKNPVGTGKASSQEILYPIYYALMGLVFGGILTLSAMNDFLFFGQLALSMGIITCLIAIHLMGKAQLKKQIIKK